MMETRLKAYRGAMVAALYAALTLGLAPLSYGAVQVRVSEFMTLLAFYDKGLIPGLTLGCLISCLLYTSPSPRDISGSRMPSSA